MQSRNWSAGVLLLLLPAALGAATIEIVAGGGTGTYGAPANQMAINRPMSVFFDKNGNWYFPEWHANRIVKVNPQGITSVFAGTGESKAGGDGGPATKASFGLPHDAIIGNGQLYFSDTGNARVRDIDLTTGIITTLAGTGEAGYSGDGGLAKHARFTYIIGLSLSPDGKRLYISDVNGSRIRMVTLATGIVTLIAGTGTDADPREGALAVESPLNGPRDAVEDSKGNIYTLEVKGNALRMIDKKERRIHTILGPGMGAPLKEPKEIAFDRNGNLIFTDASNHMVKEYSPATGKTTVLVGTGEAGSRLVPDRPLETQLSQPHYVFVHPSGDIYIADTFNDRILRLRR